MVSQTDLNVDTIKCLICGEMIGHENGNYTSLKTKNWNGIIDCIYSNAIMSNVIIGICLSCSEKAFKDGRLIKF